jgi:hypothetical protein
VHARHRVQLHTHLTCAAAAVAAAAAAGVQVWPASAPEVRPWHGPPLLTDKVVKLLRWVVDTVMVVCIWGGGLSVL